MGGVRTRNRTCGGACIDAEFSQEEPCSFYPCAYKFALIDTARIVTYTYNPYGMTLSSQSEMFNVDELPVGNYFGIYTFVVGDELFYLYSREEDRPGRKYNFKTSTWTELGKTNISNDAQWIPTKNNKIWFVGARQNYFPSGNHYGAVVYISNETKFYDPKTDTLTDGPDLPEPGIYHAMARISANEIFIAGGHLSHKDTYIYNEDSQTFLSRALLPWNCWGATAGMVRASNGDRKVIHAGGRCNGEYRNRIHIYDIKTNVWELQTFKLPERIAFPGAFVVNNKLLLLGGRKSGVNFNDVVEISVKGIKTLEALTTPTSGQRSAIFPRANPSNILL